MYNCPTSDKALAAANNPGAYIPSSLVKSIFRISSHITSYLWHSITGSEEQYISAYKDTPSPVGEGVSNNELSMARPVAN